MIIEGFEKRERSSKNSNGDLVSDIYYSNIEIMKQVKEKKISFAGKGSTFVEITGMSESERTDARLCQMVLENRSAKFIEKGFMILAYFNQNYFSTDPKTGEKKALNKWFIEVFHEEGVNPTLSVEGCEKY